MRHKQTKCKLCGSVLAVSSDPMTYQEQMQGCMLILITCGLALPFVFLQQLRRDREAKTFRCPKCGAKLK